MSEATAASASSSPTSEPPQTGLTSPLPAMVSGESSPHLAGNLSTQTLAFSSGNPRIEETRGVMHFYSNDVTSSPIFCDLPVGRKPLVCVLGVPNHMTYADFCRFSGSFVQHMLEMRIVRNDEMEDRYIVLIRFDTQDSTDGFFKHFNGQKFSSLEVVYFKYIFPKSMQCFLYLFTFLISYILTAVFSSQRFVMCILSLMCNTRALLNMDELLC